MRYRDLIVEDYSDDLRSEIINLLVAVSVEGIDEVDTQNLLADLQSQGYAIDEAGLLEILDEIDIVSTASADSINIATSDADMMVGQDADEVEADRVDSLAKKKASDDLKDSVQTDLTESIRRLNKLAGI